MKQTWTAIQAALAALGGVIGGFLGGFDGFLYALVAFVIIDYATGVMCGITEKRLSSEIGFKGIFKKVLIFVMVAVGNLVDRNLIGDGQVLRTAVIFFYAANEGISIIENAGRLGLDIPKPLRDILLQLKKKSEEAGDDLPEKENADE